MHFVTSLFNSFLMIQSMTGFGKSVVQLPAKKITIELKSLNSKSLDLNARIPSAYREKELLLRNTIANALERGKVDFALYIEITGEETTTQINVPVVREYVRQLREVSPIISEKDDIELIKMAVRMPDAVKTERDEIDEQEFMVIEKALNTAIKELQHYRTEEGKALENEFDTRTKNIQQLLKEVEKMDPDRLQLVRERLRKAVADLKENIDENRFEQELIYYLEKFDVTEEKVRLGNHLDYFIASLHSDDSNGRKLGFISQEIGREINTLGSKANYAPMQQLVVQMKDELEKIKEQSQTSSTSMGNQDKTSKKGKLLIFSAPSGSGKTTIVRHLLQFPELNLEFSVSCTTRAPRGEEKQGENYYFISLPEFKQHIKNEDFVEWEEVYRDMFYGTLKSEVERIWAKGKNVIFDIDVAGGLRIKRKFPQQTLAVFVKPPSIDELKIRLKQRKTESDDKINMRIAKASVELATAPQFDKIIKNYDLDTAKTEAYRLVSEFINA